MTDIPMGVGMTREKVFAVWGPPDGLRGSGMPYEAYTLDDGRELWFLFGRDSPYPVVGVLVCTPGTGDHKILFESKSEPGKPASVRDRATPRAVHPRTLAGIRLTPALTQE
jgi:hypothetical protein